ncbi:MAG: hypothetical protein AAF591_20110 [Verrucomicrobiota bacterium]
MNTSHSSTSSLTSLMLGLLAVFAMLVMTIGNAHAQSISTNDGGTGDWFTSPNWAPGLPSPTVGTDNAQIIGGANLSLSTGIQILEGSFWIGTGTNNANNNGTTSILTVNGGTLVAGNSAYAFSTSRLDDHIIGGERTNGTRGELHVTNGGLVTFNGQDLGGMGVGADVIIGLRNANNTEGWLNIDGGTVVFNQDDSTNIGQGTNGVGSLSLSAGLASWTSNTNITRVATGRNATGVLDVTGGTLAFDGNSLRVGNSGNDNAVDGGANGTFNVTGTGVVQLTNDDIVLGYDSGDPGADQSQGFLNVTDGGLIRTVGNGADFTIGREGIGSANVTGGTWIASDGLGDLVLGAIDVSADTAQNTAGFGQLNVGANGFVGVDDITVGAGDGSRGIIRVTGGTLDADGLMNIGAATSNGLVILSSGRIRTDENTVVGGGPSGVGSYTQNGGVLDTNTFVVGNNNLGATGSANLTGGVINTNGGFTVGGLGSVNTSMGRFDMSGGSINIDNNINIGVGGAHGVFSMNAGLVQTGIDSGGGNRNITIGNSNQAVGNGANDSVGTMIISGGMVNFVEDSTNNNNDIRVGLTNNNDGSAFGHLIVDGTGILTMNQFSNPPTTNAGDLRLGVGGNDGAQTVSGRLTVGDSAAVFVGHNLMIDDDGQSARNSVLEVNGGTVSVNDVIYLGNAAVNGESVSTWVQTGGIVQNGFAVPGSDISFGRNDAAHLEMSGGTIGSSDQVNFGFNANGDLTFNITGGLITSNGQLTFAHNNAGASAVGTVSGGTIEAGTTLVIGRNGAATVNISGTGVVRTDDTDNDLIIAQNTTSARGIVNISGGSLGSSGDIIVGTGGADRVAVVNVSGGLVESDWDNDDMGGQSILLGNAAATTIVTWNQSGGTTIAREDFVVGSVGRALLTMSGGLIDAGDGTDGMGAGGSGNVIIGRDATAIGTAIITGGTIMHSDTNAGTDPDLVVGGSGRGHLELIDGYVEVAGNSGIFVGNQTGGSGELIVRGGTLSPQPGGGELLFGSVEGAVGTGLIEGGFVDGGSLNVGNGRGPNGLDNGLTSVATGQLTITGGRNVFVAQSFVGNNDDSHGILNITGGLNTFGNANNEDLRVAFQGQMAEDNDLGQNGIGSAQPDAYAGGSKGELNISGGTNIVATSLEIAIGNDGGIPTAGLLGGGIATNGGSAEGVVNISGGFTRLGADAGAARGALVVGSTNGPDPTSASFATFNMSGGILELESIDVNVGGNATNIAQNVHNLTGGTIRPTPSGSGGDGNIVLDADAKDFTINGTTLDLVGGSLLDSNGIQNNVIISGGRVINAALVDANLTMTGSAIEPNENYVLNSNVAARSMDMNDNDLTLTGGTLIFDLVANTNAVSASNGADNSGIYGIQDLTLDLDLVTILVENANPGSLDPATFAVGDTWDLIDLFGGGTFGVSGSTAGLLTTLNTNFPLNGLIWDVSNFSTDGTITIAVPEPTRVLLMMIGAFLLVFPRRRPGRK